MSVLSWRKILRDHFKVLSSFVRSGLDRWDAVFIEEMIEHGGEEMIENGDSRKVLLYRLTR